MLQTVERVHTRVAHWWESEAVEGGLAWLLVALFVAGLLGIGLKKLGLLPEYLSYLTPKSPFEAINLAFTLLLVYEVMALILSLARSVSISLGKQFEILALILLRQSFKRLDIFGYPFHVEPHLDELLHLVSNGVGALIIFVLVGFYYRMQRHAKTITNQHAMHRFVALKKLVSLLLLGAFICWGGLTLYRMAMGHAPDAHSFFARFFTLLIFSDVLIMLIALRYQPGFAVLFRNSGYALATLLIRLSLVSPPYMDAALGVTATVFALSLTWAYNTFGPAGLVCVPMPGPLPGSLGDTGSKVNPEDS